MLQEGYAVGNTYNIYSCSPQIRIGGEGREDQKTTMATAHATLTARKCGILQIDYYIHTFAHIVSEEGCFLLVRRSCTRRFCTL